SHRLPHFGSRVDDAGDGQRRNQKGSSPMDWQALLAENWPVYAVTVTLIVAAWIDGKQLRVPNWITFPMVGTGFVYNLAAYGWEGLLIALAGMCVGLLTLLPLYAVGG